MNRIALIDGDVLLHASVWETRSFEEAKSKLLFNIQDYCDGAFCEDYIIAVGPLTGKNFRDDLYPQYKQTATRVKGRGERPTHHNDAKDFLYSLPTVTIADYCEADDLIAQWATSLGDKSVIVTIDKDLNQIPGHHYSPKFEKYFVVSEQEAKEFFLYQLMIGDSMDKIPGVEGIGPKKADLLIKQSKGDLNTLATAVLGLYKMKYNDQWKNTFLANAKLLYLQRQERDYYTFEHFEKEYLNAACSLPNKE